jgi:nicotinate-nucleotide pyrophosphorylase (carboxylating)
VNPADAAALVTPRAGPPAPLERAAIDPVLTAALDEDRRGRVPGARSGDVTSDHVVPAGARARGRLVSKADGRVSGLGVFARVFELLDPGVRIEPLARDGDPIRPKQALLIVEGSARALLVGERTALNFVQRMSGTATLTARYVALAAGRARILDTRKTTPNLRIFEKYAVRCGGGENHRFGLYDEAMVKNNHLDLAGRPLRDVLADLRSALGPTVRITGEARDESEALDAVTGGADVVMLDNLGVERMRALCPRLRDAARALGRKIEIEASGGVDESSVAEIAACGVDRVSVGALTHSARALDLSFYLEPLP